MAETGPIDYTDKDTFKVFAKIKAEDTTDDANIAIWITAASRAIDRAAGRMFSPPADTAVTRLFTLSQLHQGEVYPFIYNPFLPRRWAPNVEIDDLFDVSSVVVTDWQTGTALDMTNARYKPYNAAAKGKPYTEIVWPLGTITVAGDGQLQVVAKFGWPSIPSSVVGACLLQTNRWYVRQKSPYGIAGATQMGNDLRLMNKLDPDVDQLLGDVRRNQGAY